mgnify:FL=1
MRKENQDINQKKSRRLKPGVRLMLAAIIIILILVLVSLAVRMFGGVDMTASEVGDATSSAQTSTASESTSNLQTQSTKTQAQDSTTSSASGHYVQPAGAKWNLKLVNPWNPVDSDYAQSLVTYAGGNKFDSRAIDKLKALVSAANGKIRVASLYRTIELQTKLFNNKVSQVMANTGKPRVEAETIAATEVARPGTSEHNLGLAVDFLFEGYSSLSEKFENTATYTWMMQNCAEYGFILRFPKNKQAVTGVSFEPWHYRYVGQESAREIMSRRITLEEYLEEKGH